MWKKVGRDDADSPKESVVVTDDKQGPLKDIALGEYVAVGDEFALLKVFDCHGCEPVEWSPSVTLVIEDEEGRTFNVEDFEGAWAGTDGQVVSNMQHEFRRL